MACECGIISISDNAKVINRFVCHCLFCQEYTNDSFNDESFFRKRDIIINKPELIEFTKNYSKLSPLSRGTCKTCKSPVISIAKIPLFSLILIPSETSIIKSLLPPVCAHVFYHRRKTDLNDSIPKYSGFWNSQLMTQWFLLKSFIKKLTNV